MEATDVAQFKAQLRGELIEPGDPGYEEARKVYNGMISRKPRLIAKCCRRGGRYGRRALRPRASPAGRDTRRRP